jgi:hypothetical protein
MSTKAIAVLVALAVTQVYVQINLAGPTIAALNEAAVSVLQGQQAVGKIVIDGNNTVMLNGVAVTDGASMLDGSTIETPDGVGATLDLGPLGEIDLAPGTLAVITYSDGKMKVTLKRGCAVIRPKKNVDATIDTPDGLSTSAPEENDKNKKRRAAVCFPLGATSAIVNPSVVAGAGAGGGGGIGLGTGLGITGAIVGAVFGIISAEGENPPCVPRGLSPSPALPNGPPQCAG